MSAKDINHILYHNEYSICSLMVRYSFVLRGPCKDSALEMRIREEPVDIMHEEQLSEHFLCDINPDGEVPVLVPIIQDEKKPIPDSLEITYYMADRYPDLIPESHKDEIRRLLLQIHSIDYFALTFAGKPRISEQRRAVLERRLQEGVNERYRAAITHKLDRIDVRTRTAIDVGALEDNITKTKTLMEEFQDILSRTETDWLFSLPKPTALDAHLVVFIARLQDINRGELVPQSLKEYAARAIDGSEWKEIMNGKTTTVPSRP